ncbi:MAG: chorismate-binding protein, partial [Myxococcota bacterium]
MVELVTSLDQAREHEQDQDFDVQVSSSLQLLPTATLETSGAARYKELVRKATQEIADRKLQKVIASRTVPVSPHIDIIATYVAGRRQNSPARSFVAHLGDLKFAGFSPETVLEVNAQGRLTTQPLAGTRALVADEDENARLEAELLSDTKELAEHAISVKLAFEELGHVCEDGSVTVCEFMSVSRRGTVQHLASR